jgi:predicted GIY-YIG superfamily endonuclease
VEVAYSLREAGEGCRAVAAKPRRRTGAVIIYVYVLESRASAGRFYVGATDDLKARLKEHNAGEVSHTSKYKPWVVKNYFAFHDRSKAYAFEKYLKSGSGRTFAKRHF